MSEGPKLNLLVAIPHLSKRKLQLIRDHASVVRFFMDSGAFTAWKAGRPMPMDEYRRAIDTCPVTPWRYLTLDVIGEPEATLANFDFLQAKGYTPVPIFTRGEAPERLDYFFAHSDLVAIGGLVRTPGNKGFVKGITKRAGARDLHLLGFTPHDFISVLKPYSCDSSNWTGALRFGGLDVYMGRGRWERITSAAFTGSKPAPALLERIRSFGFDPYQLRDERHWQGARGFSTLRTDLLLHSWISYSLDVERLLGCRLFLAMSMDHFFTERAIQRFEAIVG